MKVESLKIPEVKLVSPDVYQDDRGYFMESFNLKFFTSQLNFIDFVQDNESCSEYGVLRGLHFQKPPYAQSKLMRVVVGEVFDVAVDLRSDSPTFGEHTSVRLDGDKKQMLYVPRGFAHGFLVLSKTVIFTYKVDAYYHPESEVALSWEDPKLSIKWPISFSKITLSTKDNSANNFEELPLFTSTDWE